MNVYLGSDHAGFEDKERIKSMLEGMGYAVVDCGAFAYNKDDDYPDFVSVAAQKVSEEPDSRGIVLGKSGAGEAMVANKIKGVRAFQLINEKNAFLARDHNNANVMSIGSEFVDPTTLEQCIKVFLETPFSEEERHKRRIQKISELER